MRNDGTREAVTITNEAMPATIAVNSVALAEDQRITTMIATSHAIMAPNASAAEERSAACPVAPDWSKLAQPMKAAHTNRAGNFEKARTEAAATSAAASAAAVREDRFI